jgi:3-keto-L-gulonate-6-phosphate decarboxylase
MQTFKVTLFIKVGNQKFIVGSKIYEAKDIEEICSILSKSALPYHTKLIIEALN